MEQGFTAKVVRIEQQTEEIFLIELESAALNVDGIFCRESSRSTVHFDPFERSLDVGPNRAQQFQVSRSK
jgi:hypothetical protein